MADRGRSGPRKEFQWSVVSTIVSNVDIGAAAGSITTLFTFAQAGTIRRLRGRLMAVLDPGGVTERVSVGVGIALMFQEQVTSPEMFPTTVDEADFLWKGFPMLSGEGTAVGDVGIHDRLVIDTKAMRKHKANQKLVLVVEPGAIVDATGTFDILIGVMLLDSF